MLNLRYYSINCIKCNNIININKFFCNKCNWPLDNKILNNINLYKIFQIKEEYNIDKENLKNIYLNYQNILHPDHNYGKSKEELNIITINSSLINKYYNILIDDKKRTEYLFKIKYTNHNFDEEIEKIKNNELETIMELYENIEKKETKEEIINKINQSIELINKSFQINVNKI
ncbi:uncharacterized protein TA03920 [Theileria annulata]|uniref:J domain-containing protein n=1 Tax=Theileria annulata TaxID=5874 RepID=Q4UCC0_THEAN|nr:uncharacterized protein TA03920 [Theileria annulata]CAI75531.1 hypothetical protein TA03920 [Theileria annulata]|eukprot:XP_955007.1 hypothetical protein TA03920 [Theileria annulata]